VIAQHCYNHGAIIIAPWLLHCALASCGIVYCNRPCLCLFVCLWVCYHDNLKFRASILTKTGFVGKGSDRLQLITDWPSCTPGKGVYGGAKFFGSALLQPACSVCVSLSAFFHCSCVKLLRCATFSEAAQTDALNRHTITDVCLFSAEKNTLQICADVKNEFKQHLQSAVNNKTCMNRAEITNENNRFYVDIRISKCHCMPSSQKVQININKIIVI